VAFHASGNANPSPATASFVLPAGKIRDVVDVLDSLLGLPVGSAGALRFQSNGPVAVLCRTSNVDPSGVRPGTFGSQQKPVPLLSFVSSADAGAAITGIRQDAAFRTNVGFTAGADGAQYTLTLQDAAGGTVATTSASLGAFGWTQPGIQDLFPTATIPGNATLKVKVTAGSVDVFDSSIDNLSGDPVVTPIAPIPAAIPTSATIGPQGGSIRSDDGGLTLKIPAGALGAPTQFSIVTVPNDAPDALGPAYDLSPGGLAFARPALLVLRYGVNGLPVDGIDAVSLAVLGSTGWGGLTGGRVDTTSRTLLVPFRATSPASALAGTRNAQADSNSTRIGSFPSVFVNHQGWIPTGGEMKLSLSVKGEPTSTGAGGLIVPLKEQPGISVTWSDPGDGSLDNRNNSRVTYTAPASIKYVFHKVDLEVTVGGGNKFVTKTSLYVIRRKWYLDLRVDMNLVCEGSNDSYSLNYVDVASALFHINDDLSVARVATQADPPKVVTLAPCDPVCRATAGATASEIQLGNVVPFFLRHNGFLLLGSVTVMNALPPVSIKCDPPFEKRSHDLTGDNYVALIPGVWPLSNRLLTTPPGPSAIAIWLSGAWSSAP
jgi:hypothetical protein